jgi:uncharacterized membrane protein
MRLKNLDLIVAIAIAGINIIWIQVPYHPLLLGILFALPLVLIFPGYTLTQVLFRKRSVDQPSTQGLFLRPYLKIGHPIGGPDLVVLSLGLSLTLDILVGFGLNLFPIGLKALSWTLSLGSITTVFALLAAFLRRKDIVVSTRTRSRRLRITFFDNLLLGLSILVVTGSIWLSIIRPLEPQPSFTQFWLLPANQVSKSCAVSIGVQNFETTSVTYRAVMAMNGSQTNSWSSITLAPQGKWIRLVPVQTGNTSSVLIVAELYRIDKPGVVYRNVHLTFHITAGNTNGQAKFKCA